MPSRTGTWWPKSDNEAEFINRLGPMLLKLIFEDGHEEIHETTMGKNDISVGHSGKLKALMLSTDSGRSWWPG